MKKKRIVIGLSGGVDSSVAAALLKDEGHEVIGLFMKNWHDESVTISNECPWVEDSNDALIVAQRLGIPFQTIDLSKEYKERVVDYMFDEYRRGRTPNPDILCNREVKFDIFLKAALKLGADLVATGHYCRKETIEKDGKTIHRLLAGKDGNKDQSYFLCQLRQDQLAKAVFPIGELLKPQVREIARERDLVTAEKKDSQGICFVGKVRLPDFLKQKLEPKKGLAVEVAADSPIYSNHIGNLSELESVTTPISYSLADGEVRGEHQGAHYYTIGQRKGLNIGGSAKPLFVIATDVNENIIYTGQGDDHPGLNRVGLTVHNDEVHWVRPDLKLEIGENQTFDVRIRYRQPLEKATLYQKEDKLYVVFANPQKGIAAGQFVAWYDGEELIGSGVIS